MIVTSQRRVPQTLTKASPTRPASTMQAAEHLRSMIVMDRRFTIDPHGVGANPIAHRMSSMLILGERYQSCHAHQTR
jgi:hypothetical protein